MADIVPIVTTKAPPPGGHYSQAVAMGDMLFVSGQLPVRGAGDHVLAEADFATQARQAFANLFAVLGSAGADAGDVLKVSVYVTDIADWPQCNEIYAEFFGSSRPARSIVPTGPLHFGYRIEVDAIARMPKPDTP
ncbi:RidA family protein [Novosphingobium sp. BW1]|uniref:RidA family protein n=1 Tax=Novosphingobium sp. BW1 TaxID=2592621 RepID=UPI0011DE6C7D|nr:RidA family protein [Novosphingobium sp. BW1]TYC94417.1 RidA family protein [Novosphingobium sp. BW1]